MKVVCDEQGRWWIVGEVTGDALRGPYDTEEEAWEEMDTMPTDGGDDDGRDFSPPYEP